MIYIIMGLAKSVGCLLSEVTFGLTAFILGSASAPTLDVG